MQENVEVYVDHLIACQNPICNEKSTVLWRTHKKQICSAWAALFHYECSLNIKLELNFIKISKSIWDGIIEEMIDLYKKYDDIRRDFPTYKDDLDALLQNLKDCKEIIENPQPNMINAIEKVPNCIALMNKIQSSQAYIFYAYYKTQENN